MSTKRSKGFLPIGSASVSWVIGRVAALIRGAAFWMAALLPLSYVPLLQTASVTVAGFGKLVLLNVVALLIGHGYGSDGESEGGRGRNRLRR